VRPSRPDSLPAGHGAPPSRFHRLRWASGGLGRGGGAALFAIIREILSCQPEFGRLNFKEITYSDSHGREQPVELHPSTALYFLI
jgi:hypothetical protein